jgi:hypothetical protein
VAAHLAHHATSFEDEHAVRNVGDLVWIRRNEQSREASRGRFRETPVDRCLGTHIHARRGLVDDQQARL